MHLAGSGSGSVVYLIDIHTIGTGRDCNTPRGDIHIPNTV